MSAEPAGVPPPARDRTVPALAAAGLALRLGLIWSGACDAAVIADDAYYYFTIARNLAHGLGATFDGIAPTNGFHPLWLALLVPLAAIAGRSSWLLVRLALTLGALLDVAAGLLLARLLARAGLARAGRWGVALWMLGPVAALTTQRGMEASLSAALVAAWLLAVARAADAGRWSARGALLPGALLGLAGLARTDNLPFLAAATVVVAGWAALARRAPPARSLAFVLAGGAVAALVIAPWLAWNVATFGTPFQVSGAVKALHRGVYGELPAGPLAAIANLAAWIAVPARFAAGEEFGPVRVTVAYAWLVLFALALAVAGWRRAFRAPRAPALVVLALGGGAYLAAHALAYGLVLRSYVVWYAAPPLLIAAALAGGVGVGVLLEGSDRASRRVAAALGLALALGGFARFFTAIPPRPRAPERRLAPMFVRLGRELPGVRMLGAFNAGAAGYFAAAHGGVRVTNLDGLVNNALVAAWRRGDALGWIARHVDALYVDEDKDLTIWLAPAQIDTLRAIYPPSPIPRVRGPRRAVAGRPAG